MKSELRVKIKIGNPAILNKSHLLACGSCRLQWWLRLYLPSTQEFGLAPSVLEGLLLQAPSVLTGAGLRLTCPLGQALAVWLRLCLGSIVLPAIRGVTLPFEELSLCLHE